MALSMVPLLIHSEAVPAAAREALKAAQSAPAERRDIELEAAARVLSREAGLGGASARVLVGLPPNRAPRLHSGAAAPPAGQTCRTFCPRKCSRPSAPRGRQATSLYTFVAGPTSARGCSPSCCRPGRNHARHVAGRHALGDPDRPPPRRAPSKPPAPPSPPVRIPPTPPTPPSPER